MKLIPLGGIYPIDLERARFTIWHDGDGSEPKAIVRGCYPNPKSMSGSTLIDIEHTGDELRQLYLHLLPMLQVVGKCHGFKTL